MLLEDYGHGNTCAIIWGKKEEFPKAVFRNGMHHFSPELMEKVMKAIDDCEVSRNMTK